MNNNPSIKYLIFVYTSLPGYMFNCIENLAAAIEHKIILVETSSSENYPVSFESKHFEIVSYTELKNRLLNINAEDISKVFIAGWVNNKIKQLANYFYKNNVRLVLLSDQPFKNNLRQKIGKIFIRQYLGRFENVIVPGKSGYDLMRYYGVQKTKIKTGLYTAVNKIFNEAKLLRDSQANYPKVFLFDGQFIKRKGVEFLIHEYLNYLKLTIDPWKLVMVGKGDLENIIPPLIKNLGFIHQDRLGEVYANAGCFILPSYEDHWGVVVHQAACAGLPLLISPYCGSHFELFKENINGYFINPFEKGSLSQAMLKIENSNSLKLKEMGNSSFELSEVFSAETWTKNFIEIINN
jgi:glycosyltransferase involved in cell wall biosynthesis